MFFLFYYLRYPVYNYHVPVLLVRDFQLGYYEWDLAINWVILHIDGVTNAWQLSVKAEVDLELVLACLRALRHHGVISVVDIFLYTNRYECTERAAAMRSILIVLIAPHTSLLNALVPSITVVGFGQTGSKKPP